MLEHVIAPFALVVTALATFIGLIYVGAQLRVTSDALRSAAFQGIVAHSLTLIENVIGRDETLDAFGTMMEPGVATDREGLRRHFMALATMRHFENLSMQHNLGSIDDDQWNGYRNLFGYYLGLDGFKAWWSNPRNQQWFSPAFRQLVVEIQAPLAPTP